MSLAKIVLKSYKYEQCRRCGRFGLGDNWNPKNIIKPPPTFYGSARYYCNECIEKERAEKRRKEKLVKQSVRVVEEQKGKECQVCHEVKPKSRIADWCEGYEYGFCRACWKKSSFLEAENII